MPGGLLDLALDGDTDPDALMDDDDLGELLPPLRDDVDDLTDPLLISLWLRRPWSTGISAGRYDGVI